MSDVSERIRAAPASTMLCAPRTKRYLHLSKTKDGDNVVSFSRDRCNATVLVSSKRCRGKAWMKAQKDAKSEAKRVLCSMMDEIESLRCIRDHQYKSEQKEGAEEVKEEKEGAEEVKKEHKVNEFGLNTVQIAKLAFLDEQAKELKNCMDNKGSLYGLAWYNFKCGNTKAFRSNVLAMYDAIVKDLGSNCHGEKDQAKIIEYGKHAKQLRRLQRRKASANKLLEFINQMLKGNNEVKGIIKKLMNEATKGRKEHHMHKIMLTTPAEEKVKACLETSRVTTTSSS